jgi:hypothetical protein
MTVRLPREAIDAIIREVSVFDREPLSEDVLLKAVRYIAGRFELKIKEQRSEQGYPRFRSPSPSKLTTVSVEDRLRYHCWGYDIQQGDTSEWDAKATSELAWSICGHPYKFLVAASKVVK